jgi:peptidoglycan LD-endopeptidase LytH
MITDLENALKKNSHHFHPIVEFDPQNEKLIKLDFSDTNKELSIADISDTEIFSTYIKNKLKSAGVKYGIGGYGENRTIYRRSELFKSEEERSIHLGVDIWGSAGTEIYAALGGMVHSFAFNNQFGDYGATIILLHQLDTVAFYTLYGHLSLRDISGLLEGAYITRGEVIGHFGKPAENGNWPPHLHFQIIRDMKTLKGDFPGVCKLSEQEEYLSNCPDADLILNMLKYL